MAGTRIGSEKLVLAIQWSLAIVLFESGLLEAGLPEELQARLGLAVATVGPAFALAGLAQAAAAVLLVVPSATGFLPALAPLVAAAVAVAFGAAAIGSPVPVGLGSSAAAVAIALAAGAVAVLRGVLLPVGALELGPETTNPWRRVAISR